MITKGEKNSDTLSYQSEIVENGEGWTDSDLEGCNWTENEVNYPRVTQTYRKYEYWKGKAISGIHTGDLMQTRFGDFTVRYSNRGRTVAVIVFSDTGIGHVYHTGG